MGFVVDQELTEWEIRVFGSRVRLDFVSGILRFDAMLC